MYRGIKEVEESEEKKSYGNGRVWLYKIDGSRPGGYYQQSTEVAGK
jgi:hypothetical protein